MNVGARLAVFGGLVAVIACNSKTTAPQLPKRADLNGFWQCAAARLFSYNPATKVRQWRTGGCLDYTAVTNPSREDSIETKTFSIAPDGQVRRLDFPTGRITYDENTGMATVVYSDHTDLYQASQGGLRQAIYGRDLTGDGEIDSLQLTFIKAP
ncbi:MAG: hypothetical protein ACR2OG_10310 [Gemmatimonadaceae bacterium]